MLRGGEKSENFQLAAPGTPMQPCGTDELAPGDVESLAPATGDIHRVSNLHDDQVSISIHVYGGPIGRISRHVFDAQTGTPKPFISGYSNEAELHGVQAIAAH
jgi:predicted metal-dependent enzyme (double-stranded beta helix superfamily)